MIILMLSETCYANMKTRCASQCRKNARSNVHLNEILPVEAIISERCLGSVGRRNVHLIALSRGKELSVGEDGG